MNPHNIVRNISITVLLFLFLIGVSRVFSQKKEDLDILNGYVDPVQSEQDKSKSSYYSSILNSYDPEPNWAAGESFGTAYQPDVVADSAVIIDLDSGKTLFDKNAREKRKIASLTKIMTAVLALEHLKLNDSTVISGNAAAIGENAMGISEGEVYKIEELLYGLLLNSGNDAAYALAEASSGDINTFVIWMNIKAGELGMKETYFADPSGLDDSTYSTALDLVKLTRYALKNPEFRKITATEEKELFDDGTEQLLRHKYLYLYNQTNLLSTYPGVKGVKTGYTEEAGLCLVTYAINDGKELVGVVLNSIDRKGDMILMLDHSYNTLGIKIEHDLL